jgi:hypothetical protein
MSATWSNPWVWVVIVPALLLFLRAFVRGGRMLERFAEREAATRSPGVVDEQPAGEPR